MAEQSRRGLQNLLDQCNSGTRLHILGYGCIARVAELVYAADLKSASFTGLWVRVPSCPPEQKDDPSGSYFCSIWTGREPAGFVRARSRGKQKCLHFYLRGDAANQGSVRSRCPSRPTRPRKDARRVFFVSRKNLKRDIIHLSLRRVPLALKRPTFCNRSDAMQKHKTRYTLGISI